MNATERPEIKIKIQKKGIWKLIPYGFDLFSQKFLITLENNSNQDIEVVLGCYERLGPLGSGGVGERIGKFSLRAREKKKEIELGRIQD